MSLQPRALFQSAFTGLLASLALIPPPTQAQAGEAGGSTSGGRAGAPACTLTSSELRDRIRRIEQDLLPRVHDVVELPNGFVFQVPNEEGQLQRLAEFVDLERQCCSFLDFEIHAPSQSATLALVLSGPAGTKDLIGSLFESVVAR